MEQAAASLDNIYFYQQNKYLQIEMKHSASAMASFRLPSGRFSNTQLSSRAGVWLESGPVEYLGGSQGKQLGIMASAFSQFTFLSTDHPQRIRGLSREGQRGAFSLSGACRLDPVLARASQRAALGDC